MITTSLFALQAASYRATVRILSSLQTRCSSKNIHGSHGGAGLFHRADDRGRRRREATLADYAAVAEGYAAGNMNHDVSQNLQAMLAPLLRAHADRAPPPSFDVLDVCCGSGRDLLALQGLGHAPVGLDGVRA